LIPAAIVGAALARLRAGRMAAAMLVVAAAHLLISAGGLSADRLGAMFSMVMAGPWLLSAGLFLVAARRERAAG
ncbi:MAG TPA: hypothetical protein VF552_16055, partial [Allosphingosinicella sp.]